MEISGWRVLPETYYRRSPTAFEETMTEDLNKSDLFVQLLGRYTTQKTEELPTGYEGLQLDVANRARDVANRARELIILRWLDSNNPDLKEKFIDREWLNRGSYKKMSFVDFKEEVKKQARMCAARRRLGHDYHLGHSNLQESQLA